MLYSPDDLQIIRRQKHRRYWAMLIPSVLLLGSIIFSVCIRLQWLSVTLTALLGAMLIACHDLLIRPLSDYEGFVQNVVEGRTREVTAAFSRISQDVTVVDGVRCRAILLEEYDEKGRPYDRLLYLDAQKEFPQVQAGQQLRLLVHDKVIASIETV